ncbi:MAG: SHOCT domain-containing protein [Phycisphaerales bacterium]|nr:SHOCT domain-containing protein [Phycisphaerales bacterium]
MSSNVQIAFNEMLPWLAVLLGLALVGGIVVFILRLRLLGSSETGNPSVAILDQLRTLRDRGEISDEEYETARLKMVARASGCDYGTLRADAIRKAGGLVAEPGHDLLGRPLPEPAGTPDESSGRTIPNQGDKSHSPRRKTDQSPNSSAPPNPDP